MTDVTTDRDGNLYIKDGPNYIPVETLPNDVWQLQNIIAGLRVHLAEAKSAAPRWYTPAEKLPDNSIPVLAYWQEDGVWISQFYSRVVLIYRDGDTEPANGWYTLFDDSRRTDPVCWCHPPVPAGMVCDMWKGV